MRYLRVISIGLGFLLPMVLGCGMTTHEQITQRAISWFVDDGHHDAAVNPASIEHYRSLMTEHWSYVLGGSFFPDWSFECGNLGEHYEVAHWAAFIRTAALYIRQKGPTFSKKRRERLEAFMFGIISHDVADILWHGHNNKQEGFIRAISLGSMDGHYDAAHSLVDRGAETVLRHGRDANPSLRRWSMPEDDIRAIYQAMGIDLKAKAEGRPLDSLYYCFHRGFVAAQGIELIGSEVFPLYAAQSPVLVEQIENYYRGGVTDMMGWIPHCWKELMRWINTDMELPYGKSFCELVVEEYGDYKDNWAVSYIDAQPPKINSLVSPHNHPVMDTAALSATQEPISMPEVVVTQDEGGITLSVATGPPPASPATAPSPLARRGLVDHIVYGMDCDALTDRYSSVITLSSSVSYAGLGTAVASGRFGGGNQVNLAVSAPFYKTDTVRGAIFIVRDPRQLQGTTQRDIAQAADQTLLGESVAIPVRFGHSLAVLDYNHDGIDDLVVGVPGDGAQQQTYAGKVLVFLGHSGTGLSTEPDYTIQFDASLNHNTQLGEVLRVADLNGDSRLDLLIGAPSYELQANNTCSSSLAQAGAVFGIYSRPQQTPLLTHPDLHIYAHDPSAYANFGKSLTVDTINGQRTLVVGAPGFKSGPNPLAGKIYGFTLSSIAAPTPQFNIVGTSKFQQLGHTVTIFKPRGGQPHIMASAPSETVDESRTRFIHHPIDRLMGVQRGWQKGAVYAIPTEGLQLDDKLTTAHRQIGGDDSNQFGASVALEADGQGVFVGEPFSETERGLLYLWNPEEKQLQCYRSPTEEGHQRFGSQVFSAHLDGDNRADLVVTSAQASGGGALGGAVHIALTAST